MKRLIISISFGVGFAVTAAVILWIVFWYQNQPKPPKPWNTNAITATYSHIGTEGSWDTLVFYYTLENKTAFDYKISDPSDVVIMLKWKETNSLSGHPYYLLSDKYIEPDYPIFLPAKQPLRFAIHFKVSVKEALRRFDEKLRRDTTQEEREKYREKLEVFVTENFPDLNGFIFFDERNRYQINFPNGWNKTMKESSTKEPVPKTKSP